ncbi:hypothetical protein JCM16303_004166 [Sporobolomyces ruberrimus]
MSLSLPPPPPRHPSRPQSRNSSPPRPEPTTRSTAQTTTGALPRRVVPRASDQVERPPLVSADSDTTVRSTASSKPQHDSRNDQDDTARNPLLPPPKHPGTDETSRKLAEIEDIEIAEMLDRVGGRLKELRVAADDDEKGPVEYPALEDFRDDNGKADWASYATAYASTFAVANTPPALVGHPPREEFSLRFLRDDLSRLYVLCPPSVWQGYLLNDVADLYRWTDPVQTGKAAALYTFLWFFNMLPLFPIGLLIYYLLLPRLFPPTPEEILATSTERASRTREAEELSKQLKNSSAGRGLGFAAEGIRSVFGDLKDRLPVGRSSEGKNVASALGSTALVGGMAGGGPGYGETLRQRLGQNGERTTPDTPPATSPETQAEEADSVPDPAADKDGDVSLYRLLRNLSSSFGPPLQTLLNEMIDLLEMTRNVIQHPDHPSSLPILLRLVGVFLLVLVTPTWLRLKSVFGYLGLEFFVLWKLRETFPEYRRATMIQWWIMSGAPTDADYALYILRKRGSEGRAIKGSKTIRRIARRSRATSHADLTFDKDKFVPRLAKSFSDTASIRSFASSTTSTPIDKSTNTYFAFHRSVPGQLVLTSTAIRFIPAKRLRKLGFHKLVARAAKKWDPSIELDDSYYHDGERDSLLSTEDLTRERDAEVEMVLRVSEIEKVKKEKQYRLPALEISSKDGESWKFTNVSRRDDAFNKLLSFSATPRNRA